MQTSLFLAQMIGLYALIACLLWLVRGDVFKKRMEECMTQASFLVLAGLLAIIAGLAIVIGHNVWEANWRGVITMVGYISLLKGMALLGFPEHMTKVSLFFLRKKSSMIYMAITIPLAAWLAWIGFSGG